LKVFPHVMITYEDAGDAGVLLVEADTRSIPADRMEELARGIEAVVSAVAAGPGASREPEESGEPGDSGASGVSGASGGAG
jgi:hypothetical protein